MQHKKRNTSYVWNSCGLFKFRLTETLVSLTVSDKVLYLLSCVHETKLPKIYVGGTNWYERIPREYGVGTHATGLV